MSDKIIADLEKDLEVVTRRNAELYSALLLAHGIATRVIDMTNFDESQVSDWRPQVESALRIDSMLPNGSDVYGAVEYTPENTLYELSLSARLCKVQLIRLDFDHKVDKMLFVIDANKLASLLESKLTRDSLSEKMLQLSYYVYSCDQQCVLKHLTDLEYLDSETESSFIRHWNANKFPISTDEVDFALRIVTRKDSISVYHDNVNVKLDGLSYKAEVNPEGGVTVDVTLEASDWAARVGQDKSRIFRAKEKESPAEILEELRFDCLIKGNPKVQTPEQQAKFEADLKRLKQFSVIKFTTETDPDYVLNALVRTVALDRIKLIAQDFEIKQYGLRAFERKIMEHSEVFYNSKGELKKSRYELENVPVDIHEHFKEYLIQREGIFEGSLLIHLTKGLEVQFNNIVALSPEDHAAAHAEEKKL